MLIKLGIQSKLAVHYEATMSMSMKTARVFKFTPTFSVIIRPWGRKIRAYWCYFPSARGDVLMITLNLK